MQELRGGGINRISFGMQSAVPHVLAALDRRHTPGPGHRGRRLGPRRRLRAGQRRPDLRRPGRERRRLGCQRRGRDRAGAGPRQRVRPGGGGGHAAGPAGAQRRGQALPTTTSWPPATRSPTSCSRPPATAGMRSATGRVPARECRHNLGYWRDGSWWGIGPGAHSFVGDDAYGVRWWNVRQPAAYAARLAAGRSPAAARELLGAAERRVRTADAGSPAALRAGGGPTRRRRAEAGRRAGRARACWRECDGRFVLTLRGRLLADLVVRRLTG